MPNVFRQLDASLNRFTMYRILLYDLIGLLVAADALAWFGKVSIGPAGLLISVGLLVVSCYAINFTLATILQAPRNTESWLITALILACILPPTNSLHTGLLVLLAGAIAMASKYAARWRGAHIFNPAAFGAFVLSVTQLLPATWWIATPWLTPFTVFIGFITLRKNRRFSLFTAFAAVAIVLGLYISVGLHSASWSQGLQNALVSTPLIFMGTIMLTEPSTLPPTRYYQVLLGILVGAIYASQLHIGHISATPQAALMVAGLFTLLVASSFGAILRLKATTKLSPDLYDLAFEKPRGFRFYPGQYLEWTLPHSKVDSRGNRRMFSIASSPGEAEVHIGIKRYEPSSSFKAALLNLKPGQYIRGAHVAGNFTLPADVRRPLLFIAGGIGITPFRSMLRHITDSQQQRDIVLLYSVAKQEDAVYQEVYKAAEQYGVRTHIVVGRISTEQIKDIVGDISKRDAYISGPDAMVSGTKQLLKTLGVSGKRIYTDHFTGY